MSKTMTAVTCVVCNTQYPAPDFLAETQQAEHCAATIFGDKIQAFYGSVKYDGDVFEFIGGRPENIPEGTICDNCITDFLDRGLIKVVASDVYF